jgi:serine/threonine protein kinase
VLRQLQISHDKNRTQWLRLPYVSIQFIVDSYHDEWGTPQMMAPELWSEETPAVHPSADIFALGILLWEMASRQRPWCETP